MLRPAGPRISSMMPVTRSAGRYSCSSRSVPSNVPISAPDADIRETNSSSRSSTTSASTVPSVDMWIDNSRTSSSSSNAQTLPPYCSPSASIRIAARFGPVGLTARQRRDDGGDVVDVCGLRYGHVRSLDWFAEPLTDNGGGLVRISFGEFTDPMHGLRVDLALNLGDVDQRGG